MLLEGHRLGQPAAVALAAALLSERDPFPPGGRRAAARAARRAAASESDVLDRVAAMEAFEQSGRLDTPLGPINRSAARLVLHVRGQLLRKSRRACGKASARAALGAGRGRCVRSLLAGEAVLRSGSFPDRLARRSGPGSRFGRMVGGRGLRLADRPRGPRCAAVSGRGRRSRRVGGPGPQGLGRRARAGCRRSSSRSAREVEFDRGQSPGDRPAAGVLGRPAVGGDARGPAGRRRAGPDPGRRGGRVARRGLSLRRPGHGRYVSRVRCLAQWMPELELPALDDEGLRALLPRGVPGLPVVRRTAPGAVARR